MPNPTPAKRERRSAVSLDLGVKRRLSRRNDPARESAQADFERQRLGVLERDNWTCRGCGFASKRMHGAPAGGMEVHHLDDDHHNNHPANLATLCPLCHMTFTLGRRGYRFDARLIYAPTIEQWQLNMIHHVVWGLERALALMDAGDEAAAGWRDEALPEGFRAGVASASDTLMRIEKAGAERLKSQMSETLPQIEDAETLYGALQNLPPAYYQTRDQLIRPIRLMPIRDRFTGRLDRWARGVWLASYPPRTWRSIVESVERLERESGRPS